MVGFGDARGQYKSRKSEKMKHTLLADIVLDRGDNLLSKGILECQRQRGEGKSIVSHAGLIVEGGNPLKSKLIESLHTTVIRNLSYYLDGKRSIIVFRNRTFDGSNRVEIVKKAMEYTTRSYGYHIIAAHFMDYLLGGKYVFRKMFKMGKYDICSWKVSYPYASIGYKFLGIEPNLVQPDDIWDHIMKTIDEWEVI
jgi:hypothetical protein